MAFQAAPKENPKPAAVHQPLALFQLASICLEKSDSPTAFDIASKPVRARVLRYLQERKFQANYAPFVTIPPHLIVFDDHKIDLVSTLLNAGEQVQVNLQNIADPRVGTNEMASSLYIAYDYVVKNHYQDPRFSSTFLCNRNAAYMSIYDRISNQVFSECLMKFLAGGEFDWGQDQFRWNDNPQSLM
ncbi:hypothetical protein L596_029427 [Steinernema carpocapsae]|uniref:Uncharacterized protein n=1 Tax=Steinernema carpocapsae TaxID=34508 RepID=A0A4U5LUM2_STECR|nr:hypothetical protein L596_029427 [Steinernema carpocapsae]